MWKHVWLSGEGFFFGATLRLFNPIPKVTCIDDTKSEMLGFLKPEWENGKDSSRIERLRMWGFVLSKKEYERSKLENFFDAKRFRRRRLSSETSDAKKSDRYFNYNEKLNFGCRPHLITHILYHIQLVYLILIAAGSICVKTENEKSVWNKCSWRWAIACVT